MTVSLFCCRQDLIEHGEIKLVLTYSSTDSSSWYYKILWIPQKEIGKCYPRFKPFNLQWWPTCKMHYCNSGTNLVREIKQYLIVFKAHCMRWNPNTAWVTKNPWLDMPGLLGKIKYCQVLLKEQSNKMIPKNTLLYSEIGILLSYCQRSFLLQ